MVQLEPYPRILIIAHMLCAVCLPVDLSSSYLDPPTKIIRPNPRVRTRVALHSHIRALYRRYGVVGCHNGRRAGTLVQKHGGSTSSKGSAFTTAVRFLGGTLRAEGRELLAVIPLTACARDGEFGGGLARRGHSARVESGSSLVRAPAPSRLLLFHTTSLSH